MLTPLITGVVGALAYGLVGRRLDPDVRPDFELAATAGVAGMGAAAVASAAWPCSAIALGAVALLAAAGFGALLAPSFFARPGSPESP
ncbi:MAG: hypothetical protein PVH68_01725 [Armatimonadota bacterium]